jgi:hypothetical protein
VLFGPARSLQRRAREGVTSGSEMSRAISISCRGNYDVVFTEAKSVPCALGRFAPAATECAVCRLGVEKRWGKLRQVEVWGTAEDVIVS